MTPSPVWLWPMNYKQIRPAVEAALRQSREWLAALRAYAADGGSEALG